MPWTRQRSMDNNRYVVQIFVGSLSRDYEALTIEASKQTSALEIVSCISDKLNLDHSDNYELAEVIGNAGGQECKERRLGSHENPVAVQMLWPKVVQATNNEQNEPLFQAPEFRFCLREKQKDSGWIDGMDARLIRDYFLRFLYQPRDKEYPDLCQLPDLNETTLLDNLKARFESEHIYTFVGSILIAVNPFKFHPIYNPKYVKLYQNKRLDELPPHIFAIADSAYHAMLRDRTNQCIVISGESGSGKTESTNFLLHHLTALSQKGSHGSGVEQTILSAGPVLEAFGNAKTAHNNNSSRFGKFIQVNYKENGMVQGAAVHKYLLEKSRIVSQAKQERNYHVFYYLLAGALSEEKAQLSLGEAKDYYYLNQSDCYTLEGADESYEFQRLKQSMEMVGFSAEKQKRLFCVLSALLHLGNVEFMKKSTYHHDEAVWVKNPQLVQLISQLLRAIAARDALAKCLYGALFDWIVLQLNHALLSKNNNSKDYQGNAIGVLDIFGFEDFGWANSFEQFCINFANEHLQFYFNQHVFKYEQEEYKREGIRWKNIDFIDNTDCLQLIEAKPNGLLCVLDDQCNFPGASNETLLQKFHNEYKDNEFYGVPQKRESAFIINHYAGKVKYQIKDFREKNLDLMRPDIVSVLKNSNMAFVRELVGADPVAVFRWAILRAFFRGYFAFVQAGQKCRTAEGGGDRGLKKAYMMQSRKQSHTDKMMSTMLGIASVNMKIHQIIPTKSPNRKANVAYQPKDLHGATGLNHQDKIINNRVNSRKSLVVDYSMFEPAAGPSQHLNVKEARALQRANRIITKNKSFRPRTKTTKSLKNLMSVKTLACRTQIGGALNRGTRKQPMTVSAQFQSSLGQLMETLNQANPFFVRCIKSNADKIPNKFDEEIILRQLRYTGMLETVRIRQSGYNVRLIFEEFIQHYRILLHKGLLSSQADVREFLLNMNLDRENYQIGNTKVFLRESEKLKLDHRLHQAILARIVIIQRWYRTILERRAFLKLRYAITKIQANLRRHLVQRVVASLRVQHYAAVVIQKYWRSYVAKTHFKQLKKGVLFLQNCARGYKARERFHQMLQDKRKKSEQNEVQNDEAFMSKESSQEELENDHLYVKMNSRELRDSEESSGIQEDAEIDSAIADQHHPSALLTPPESPAASNESKTIIVRQRELVEPEIVDKPEEKRTKLRKKLSLKRSKSEKFSTADVPPAIPKRADKISKCYESPDLDRVPPIYREARNGTKDTLRLGDDFKVTDHNSSKGAFQKAKKHLKTIMGVGKKRNSHEDSEDSGSEEVSGFSFHTSFDSTKSPEVEYSPIVEKEQIDSTHHFKTSNKFSRGEMCAYCDKGMSSLFAQGYRCTDCHQAFHPKCVQSAHKRHCQVNPTQRSPSSRRRSRRHTLTRTDLPPTSWNVTRMSEFTDRNDHIISHVNELQSMDAFIFKKICQINEDGGKRDTIVDVVFKKALKEFKANLISTYSVAAQDGRVAVRYKDLISNFEQVMENVCRQECMSAAFPVTMGVNAFRGFINEFVNQLKQQRADEKTKVKTKKEKRKKDQIVAYHLGHSFMAVVVNIPTVCELCSSFIWLTEKSLVCQNCKLTCHRKCCNRITNSCKDEQDFNNPEGKVFGVSLAGLLTEDAKIPLVIDRLITIIELKGLYTEGLYRKPGASSKVRALKTAIETDPDLVNFDNYAIHVLTSTLKWFFREMNVPLMTYESYDEFIRATDISDPQERLSTLFSIISKLPKPNFDLLERLMFHLARVAQHEEFNRMSPNALSIVFAPCILGTNRNQNAQDSLNDVNKQTTCIEFIIQEQLKKLKITLADIDTIDTACHTASNRLSSIRSTKPKKSLPIGNEGASEETADYEDILSQHIETLQNEKVLLTTVLPTLTRTSSDDEMLSTDVESTIGSLDDINRPQYEEYALTFEIPATPSALQHLTKNRAGAPLERRPPTRFGISNSKGLDYGEDGKETRNGADTSVVSIELVYKEDAIMV
uniref:Unconventional myosin-IXb n=1 Tax=Strigamia maritima TaxID=126957 RepID=T1JDE0_STRMM